MASPAATSRNNLVGWNEFYCRTISGNGGQLIKLEGQIYFGSSSGGLLEYIKTKEEWKPMPPVEVWEFGLGACNGKLFIVGGKNLSFDATIDVLYYEEATRRWRQGTPMIQKCKHPIVLSIRSGLVVMGEMLKGGCRVQVFDSGKNHWYYGNELPSECKEISSASHNGDVVFINKARSKSVWYASIEDLIQPESSSTTNQIWTAIKDIPNCSAFLSIYNGVLLAIGGRKEPNTYQSVYAYSFDGQEWSHISTMPHECCDTDTAALEIPETQEIMLVKASSRLLMKGRVLDYDSYMSYKIGALPRKEQLRERKMFQLLLDVASEITNIDDWNQMRNNLGIINGDCTTGGISDAESYRNILFTWWKNHGNDATINHILIELESINPGAARRIRTQYQEDISGGKPMLDGTINDPYLWAKEFMSQLSMTTNQCQTMGILKPTGSSQGHSYFDAYADLTAMMYDQGGKKVETIPLLNMECSEEDVYTIAEYDFDWCRVGRRLLSDQKVRDIDGEGSSVGDKRERMLLEWKRTKSRNATYQALVKVLRGIQNNATADLVEELERKSISQGLPQTAQATPSALATSEIVAGDIILNEKDVIGDGAQSCVYKALWKSKHKNVAVKKIGSLSNATKREIETLKSVRHKNIVSFYGVYETAIMRFCLVLELADTSLDKHLKNTAPSPELSLNWALQVGQGMHYLHYGAPEAIVHGDLKSSNVLVFSGGVVKIGDFGSSKFKEGQQSSTTRITTQWTAPELFDGKKHSMESDVYAFGILLWEMVTHEVPYQGLSTVQIISEVSKNQRPSIPSFCHETLRGIMQQCWNGEPTIRPSFKIVLKRLESIEDLTGTMHDQGRREVGTNSELY